MRLTNGAVGTLNYSINSFEKNAEGSFTIIGEHGMVKIGGQYLNTIEWLQTKDGATFQKKAQESPNEYGFYTGSMSNHRQVYEDVINALENKANNLPEISEAAKTVDTIERIYKHSD
jgi:predicted dehydrogenase